MEIETLNALNEGLYLSLTMIKVIVLAIAGFATYFAGIVWFCEETRWGKTAPRPNIWKSVPHVTDIRVRTII